MNPQKKNEKITPNKNNGANFGIICKILILIPYLIMIPNEINILTLIDKIFDIIIPADPNYTKIINDKLYFILILPIYNSLCN